MSLRSRYGPPGHEIVKQTEMTTFSEFAPFLLHRSSPKRLRVPLRYSRATTRFVHSWIHGRGEESPLV